MKKVFIKENFIKLDSALKLASAVGTGGHAKIVIQNGEVAVNGEICLMRGKKLYKGDVFTFEGQNFVIENEN
ncbi:MAG: RNA-binding S4 domain-containing protein [Ruminococcaceae bacterium]|nr:RNA-binding S4 domain-containing protein [Oscillospiraceae bacterium]